MPSGRRQYPFHLIEPKWQQNWDTQQIFRAWNPGEDIPASHPFAARHKISGNVAATQLPPKFYILDMFPYPSGAGLHVGHPEGYTATDILARYRRAQGFNVLHPMGWDAFGLPAEQYAVKTGQHPRKTTEENIATFKRQIQGLGFSYDWSRELATTDPDYFKWTQWIFLKLYNSWFNPETNKAEPIETLKHPAELQTESVGRASSRAESGEGSSVASPHQNLEGARRAYRDSKRLAYVTEAPVWWCEQLGTVLANEEVVDGKSEVGGFPVTRKPMRQWMLRITAYAERLLQDLDTIDWSNSLKEMQRNWIGRSEGAEVRFQVAQNGLGGTGHWPVSSGDSPDGSAEGVGRLPTATGGSPVPPGPDLVIEVFTTRPDTLFGATYMVLSPEHPLIQQRFTNNIIPTEWPEGTPKEWTCGAENPNDAIVAYQWTASVKSDLERTELAKEKTGVFTGAYAINPVNGEKIPIWIADYVLASYGTGAIMAVPGHDTRDFEFATKFNLPIVQVVLPSDLKSITLPDGKQIGGAIGPMKEAFCEDGVAFQSPPSGWRLKDPAGERCDITSLPTAEAKKKITDWLESKGLGKRTINYKLRDWLFSRQRYWGEPFPIVWKKGPDGQSYHEALPESALPVLPPTLEDYKPMPDGQPPLARAKDWVNLPDGSTRETNTMPQWAGSCWYYLRYLDAKNSQSFTGKSSERYWMGNCLPPFPTKTQWPASIRELLCYAAGHGAGKRQRLAFSYVNDLQAGTLKQATGRDLAGRFHSIDNYAINHIRKTQGAPFTQDPPTRMVVYDEDFVHLPTIVERADEIKLLGTSRGFDVVAFSKVINQEMFVVEELVVGRNLMAVATMYKTHVPKAAVTRAAIGASVFTSETTRRGKNLAHSSPPYNADFSHFEAQRDAYLDSIKQGISPTPGVDLYVGGTEHAVLHLLYARFWHKVLYDLGYVSTPEPFFKLVNQGLILGEDGQKMSKSRGNVVNPDDILKEYGADAFRLYEMFLGPLQDTKPWSTKNVEGVYRFLGRVWRLFVDEKSETEFEQAETTATEAQRRRELLNIIKLSPAIKDVQPSSAQLKSLHACIKKVTEDLEGMRFNTAISAMMVFVNDAMTWETKPVSVLREFLILLAPFAPHIAEELWEKLSALSGQSSALSYAPWPRFDPALLVESEIEIPVQVNGKLRDVIKVPADADNAAVEAAAKTAPKVKPFIEAKTIKKVIVVPKKLVNIVVG